MINSPVLPTTTIDSTTAATTAPKNKPQPKSTAGKEFARALDQAQMQHGDDVAPKRSEAKSADKTQSNADRNNSEKTKSANTDDATTASADANDVKDTDASSSDVDAKTSDTTKDSDTDKSESGDQSKEANARPTSDTTATVVVAPPVVAAPLAPDATAVLPTTTADATVLVTPALPTNATTTAAVATTPTGAAIDVTTPTTPAKDLAGANANTVPAATAVAASTTDNTPVPVPNDLPDQQVFNNALAEAVTTEITAKVTELATKTDTNKAAATAAIADLGAKAAATTMAAPLQTSAASTASAITGTKDISAPAPSAPYTQVVGVVSPLKTQGDGNYTMTLNLRPEHLGKVQVAVSMHNGEISMQMQADNPNSRQLLRDSMNDLRSSLTSAGLSTGSLDVGTQSGNSDQNRPFSFGQNPSRITQSDDEMTDAEFFARLAPAASGRTSDGSFDARV